MNYENWLQLMKFPEEWTTWELLPNELKEIQLSGYEPGHEEASEHDRHGAFQWWLKHDPSPEILIKLARLTWLDPDSKMGGSVRKAINQCYASNEQVVQALETPYVRP
jgi:hypothetical protein